ncbi:MAG: branched-chain amino acid ABC transporter permease [Candidatus Bathyarchaeia archaeon]
MDWAASILQIIIYGIARGCVYVILALGLNLIMGTMKIINLSHGVIFILAAYMVYSMSVAFPFVDPYVLMFLALLLFFVLGAGLYLGLFARVKTRAGSTVASFGLLKVLEVVILIIWTANPKIIPSTYSMTIFSFGFFSMAISRVILIFTTLLTAFLSGILLMKTIFGKAVRAISEDATAASLMGINVSKINCLSFSLGIVLCCLAGATYGINYSFDPYGGLMFTLKGIVSITIGGLGSMLGAVVGGCILGIVENAVAYQIGAGWQDVAAYLAFLLILLFKPRGIFGRKGEL